MIASNFQKMLLEVIVLCRRIMSLISINIAIGYLLSYPGPNEIDQVLTVIQKIGKNKSGQLELLTSLC